MDCCWVTDTSPALVFSSCGLFGMTARAIQRLVHMTKVCWRKSRCMHTSKSAHARVFSGIQPTGILHLGNYFGAVQKWVELQNTDKELLFCIVDLHSLTMPQSRTDLGTSISGLTAGLLACGIDPERATLFLQSAVPQHTQLAWLLGCLTTMPRLAHLPQYREKSAALKDIPLGIYIYPVLQAADILLYKATEVPVGEDQVQHIQLAQHLAKCFNKLYGDTFLRPKAVIADDSGGRVRSLRDPAKKMSKSDPDPRSCVYLTDPPEVITEKLKKALTDFTSEVYFDPVGRPAVSHLISLHCLAAGISVDEAVRSAAGLTTAQYKLYLAEVLNERLAPIRDQWCRLAAEPAHLRHVLELGRQRADRLATETWQQVTERVQLKLT